MKNKLFAIFGTFGYILYILASLGFCIMPFLVLNLSFWLSLILLFVVFLFDAIGGIALIGMYIWAFIEALSGPQSTLCVIFYVVFALYVLWVAISFISAFRD